MTSREDPKFCFQPRWSVCMYVWIGTTRTPCNQVCF